MARIGVVVGLLVLAALLAGCGDAAIELVSVDTPAVSPLLIPPLLEPTVEDGVARYGADDWPVAARLPAGRRDDRHLRLQRRVRAWPPRCGSEPGIRWPSASRTSWMRRRRRTGTARTCRLRTTAGRIA